MNRQSRRYHNAFLAWNAVLLPFVPALGAYTLYRRYVQKKSAASLRGQWGSVPPEVAASLKNSPTRIWMHAVSVGETLASRPVARALKARMPQCAIALSVTTDAGCETAQNLLKNGEVDGVFYFPLDVPFAVKRVLDALEPHAFLTMETELWPNVLHMTKQCGAKTFLVNGRVSDNLLRRAPQLRGVWRWMMRNLDGFLMRSALDAERLERLGAPSQNVHITGDVKLDAMANVRNAVEVRAHWRRVLGMVENAPLLIAGSTHEGEEAMILRAWKTLRPEFPTLRVLVAPRHIERVGDVMETCRTLAIDATRRSIIENDKTPPDVIVLDSVGELSQIYAAADVAFVGGSLIKRGGHNLLEPVLCGVPVVFGPHIANFRAHSQLVAEADVGKMVANENELIDVLRRFLRDENWRAETGERAEETLRNHRGASDRVAQIVAQSLEPAGEAATAKN